jgi:pyruvate/2-oxoglutarate dehydrogenase complex dihydrolipoamide acyltransferase (E2) component
MKTTHLIALTATIVACTAATASARPAIEPPGSQSSKAAAVTPASIAAHREQISNEQWQRSQTQPAAAPLTDRTATDSGLPIVLVLLGVAVPLGLAFLVGRPILGYARHRHHPTSVA